MPDLLDELTSAFQAAHAQPVSRWTFQEEQCRRPWTSAPASDGFDIEEVVAEYNLLRACIHDLADEHGFNLQGKPFHILNRVFDQAIGLALQTYATQRALEVKERREEYLAFVAHDLNTPLFAISLAGRSLERNLPKTRLHRGFRLDAGALRRGVHQLEGLVQQVLAENSNLESGNRPKTRAPRVRPMAPRRDPRRGSRKCREILRHANSSTKSPTIWWSSPTPEWSDGFFRTSWPTPSNTPPAASSRIGAEELRR